MRTLKFRVWSEKDNTYIKMGSIVVNSGINTEFTDKDAKYIIEQYTGLKDKKGKEIYEGDIVKKPVFGGDYLVEIVNFNKEEAQFQAGVFSIINVEIIGNIHESPKDFRQEHLKRMGISISKGGEE